MVSVKLFFALVLEMLRTTNLVEKVPVDDIVSPATCFTDSTAFSFWLLAFKSDFGGRVSHIKLEMLILWK